MSKVEGLYFSAMKNVGSVYDLASTEGLPTAEQTLHFAMRCNGYFKLESGEWIFKPKTLLPFTDEFKAQNISFFGPGAVDDFFSANKVGSDRFEPVFRQPSVIDVLIKYQSIDGDQAARIAFILGGVIRHLTPMTHLNKTLENVDLVARMTKLGEGKSGDAIASAMAMYVVSERSPNLDNQFSGYVYRMADAIRTDPFTPITDTIDLGLSQVARLRAFSYNKHLTDIQRQIDGLLDSFEDFPTVGAEFHFPLSILKDHPDFWQRLAILNMTQYQRGSYIQLSRNDREIIEVRMNPSVYPVTIENWNQMRSILPEFNRAFFTTTINRRANIDFKWRYNDKQLLENLRAIGLLSYAATLEEVPPQSTTDEIDYGSVYLGQTIRFISNEYSFTGNWMGRQGEYGQLGIYTGFGKNFPYLAYYLSMVLNKPDILEPIPQTILNKVRTLNNALDFPSGERRKVFQTIQSGVEADYRLNQVLKSGKQIRKLLEV